MCAMYMAISANARGLSYGYDSYMSDSTGSSFAVRPVVTLKSDVIDVSTNYSTEGEWKLK